MVDNEENTQEPELDNIDSEDLKTIEVEGLPKEIGSILDNAYEGMPVKYNLKLTQTSNSNTYKTVIETNPVLRLGRIRSEGKGIAASNLEIIAKSPDFNGSGGMTINVLTHSNKGSYSFGKNYNNPKKLEKDYLNLIEEIKRKHIVNKGLNLDLFPIDSKPQKEK